MLWPLAEFGALPQWLTVLAWVIDVGIRVLLLGIVPGGRRPAVAMAWLLIIFFLPLPGLVLFLLLGSFRLGGQRGSRQRAVTEALRRATAHLDLPNDAGEAPEYVVSAARLTRNLTSFPMLDGNHFEFITDYRASMRRMAEDIDRAQEYVHLVFYILAEDPEGREGYADVVLDALERARARGVSVRILFDHVATLRVPGYRRLLRRLDAAGLEYRQAMPVMPLRGKYQRLDLRNHRKILVVDGLVGYTGSQNLIEPGYKRRSSHRLGREWVDLMARITGPTVASLDIVFVTDWFSETGDDLQGRLRSPTEAELVEHEGSIAQVVPSGPGFSTENNLRLFNHLFYAATRRIVVVSPYLVPDDSMLYALTTAAQRGVEVELFVCRKADQVMVHHAQQSYYDALLSAGIRIHRYPDPNVLHAKLFTIDDDVAVFGSSNMDMRSFSLNMEVSVLMVGSEMVQALQPVIEQYREVSEELTAAEWRARPRAVRWVDNVFRLTSALQ
ncbi:cardiolipin synthase [Citricoccus sp. SGAir0253]|uniref:cardiolipin synthase n=1 Tax=Citricoccus sp. SGAir0253 TaxID=2567881 RepID=UPI0010CCC555|nr:cardiolipin synthase [Citricoccus sp. SGAir0253]QCU77296.1 cardiolipin synthase [Citricoccus sp. SGAir0253]